MAKRPSVKEILEAARRGGPPRPDPDAEPAPTPPPSAVEAAPTAPETPPPVSPAPADPAPSGRPLTMKEKLAAARGQAAAPASSTPAASTPAAPTAAKSAGRPLTMKEKLAAARGQAAPSAPEAKPAAAKAPAASAAPQPAAARVLPPLDQIKDPRDLAEALRRAGARKDQEAAAKAAPAPKPAAKPGPAKPSTILPPPDRDQVVGRKPSRVLEMGRRPFLALMSPVAVAWSSFAGAIGLFTAMMGRFMFPNVLAEPPSTVKVGLPSSYDPDEVSERFKAEWGFWIVRSSEYDGQDAIFALKAVCTHLGCPPNWLPNDHKFKCPCHGSGFDICGVNFEGPAPRPLERYRVALADDGQILVDKSQWYQQELGQWSDPDSFIPV